VSRIASRGEPAHTKKLPLKRLSRRFKLVRHYCRSWSRCGVQDGEEASVQLAGSLGRTPESRSSATAHPSTAAGRASRRGPVSSLTRVARRGRSRRATHQVRRIPIEVGLQLVGPVPPIWSPDPALVLDRQCRRIGLLLGVLRQASDELLAQQLSSIPQRSNPAVELALAPQPPEGARPSATKFHKEPRWLVPGDPSRSAPNQVAAEPPDPDRQRVGHRGLQTDKQVPKGHQLGTACRAGRGWTLLCCRCKLLLQLTSFDLRVPRHACGRC
jgi:hypothetical protein